MIKLGSRVKDKISGFQGIASARTEYLNGCARVVIDPEKLDKDGNMIEGKYFDEPQLDVIEEDVITLNSRDTGGPHDHKLPSDLRR